MRLNKQTLLYAAKKSRNVEEMAMVLGREGDWQCERIWERMLRVNPGSENFLIRNESLQEMQVAALDHDFGSVKIFREDYMVATWNLLKSGMKHFDENLVADFVKKLDGDQPAVTSSIGV